jgi:CheY-like chemotaxis protein
MPGGLSGCSVLVVEDEMIVGWLLEDMLCGFGCTVVGPAVRVDQALELINLEAVDAAVLDVNLDGELSYSIADLLIARGVPFVFSTGYDRDSLPAEYRSRPVLQKPFHSLELAEALEALLAAGRQDAVVERRRGIGELNAA